MQLPLVEITLHRLLSSSSNCFKLRRWDFSLLGESLLSMCCSIFYCKEYMDANFYQFVKNARSLKKAHQTQIQFSKEVTGRGRTQDLVSIAGSKPDAMKDMTPKYAKPVAFSGERPLGQPAKGRAIPARFDPPTSRQKKNVAQAQTFPKTFSDKVEKPPDNLFKTRDAQSTEPWKHPGARPMNMSVPPIRVHGQKLFPLDKKDTVQAWKTLMTNKGARTMELGSAPRVADPQGQGQGQGQGLPQAPLQAPPQVPPTALQTKLTDIKNAITSGTLDIEKNPKLILTVMEGMKIPKTDALRKQVESVIHKSKLRSGTKSPPPVRVPVTPKKKITAKKKAGSKNKK
eukprot:m.356710 g.356710  ORF g.356710 m.356710 type:complete len:343 (-) comp16606_c0_seq6:2021-3049(-)